MSDHDLRLMEIVDEYTQRAQDGKSPSVSEYCEQNPELAEELRELLGVLDVMEDLRPVTGDCELTVDANMPDQIGDYRIIGEIGRGGMGVVYEAEQISLSRRVALKVLPHKLLDSASAKVRFQREARAAAKMHHTNIVPVFEVGEQDGYFYYAMQLIDGRGLDEILSEFMVSKNDLSQSQLSNLSQSFINPRSNDSKVTRRRNLSGKVNGSTSGAYYRGVAQVGQQTAEALAYAHERNVVHRDIKPSNLLLDMHGVAWVTDFGLAKLLESDEDLTNTGDQLGTLRYMSPERFKGQSDERADIYSLGITLYELATKRPALESNDRVKLIYLITETDPTRPRSVDPNIPRDLETIILKAIEKEPAARFSSADEMAAELGRFLNDEPIKARRITFTEQSLRWMRRNRMLAASLTCVAALLLLLGICGPIMAFRQSELRSSAELAQETAEAAQQLAVNEGQEAKAAELEAKNQRSIAEEALKQQTLAQQDARRQRGKYVRNLFFSEMNLAGDLLQDAGGAVRVREILGKWRSDPEAADLLGWEWQFLEGAVSGQSYPLQRSSGARTIAWSPDSMQIAFPSLGFSADGTARQGNIRIEESVTGKLVATLEGAADRSAHEICWSPRGDIIASVDSDSAVRIWDVESKSLLRKFGPYRRRIRAIAWSPNGDRLVWSVDGDPVYLLELSDLDGQPKSLPGSTSLARYLQFSPDGTHLATGIWFNNEAGVYSLEENEYVHEFTTRLSQPGTVVGWRDGHDVAYVLHSTPSGRIDMYTAAGELMRSFYGHSQWAGSLDIMPDGKGFVSGGRDGNVFVWDIRQGRPIKQIVQHLGEITAIRLSPNQRYAASISNDSVHLWYAESQSTRIDLQDRNEQHFVRQHRVSGLSWNPDGTRLAASGYDYMSRIWDPAKRNALHRVGMGSPARFAAWHPTKNVVATGGVNVAFIDAQSGEVTNTEMKGQMLKWNVDGTRFARIEAERGHRIFVHSYPDLEVLAEFPCDPEAMAWHPSLPNRLAFLEERSRRIIIAENSRTVLSMIGPNDKAFAMDWSPDGSKLAIGYRGNCVRLWDLESGQKLDTELEHNNAVLAVQWNRDGSRLASGSVDGTLRIWETREWHHTFTHRTSGSGITSLAWNPDSSKIAAGDESGLVAVWLLANSSFSPESEHSTPRLMNHDDYLAQQFQPIAPDDRALQEDVIVAPVEPKLVRSEVANVLMSPDFQWSEPVRLSDSVNSQHNEDSPFVTADGLQLYFDSDRPEGNGGLDLYVSSRESTDDAWGPAENIGSQVNTAGNDHCAYVTPDGLALYFSSDSNGVFNLFVSKRNSVEEAWSEPMELPDPINSISVDLEMTMSPDGLTMLFLSGREPKHQVCDLVITQRESLQDEWPAPKSLGPWLNSSDWQANPKLLGDQFGSTLLFHSADGLRVASRQTSMDTFAAHEAIPESDAIYGAFSLFLCNDGRTLYFRRQDPDTEMRDLWYSVRTEKE